MKYFCGWFSFLIFTSLFAIFSIASILAISTGAFLFWADYVIYSENLPKSTHSDMAHMMVSSEVIGILSIIFAVVFISNAVDIGIILFCGQKRNNLCILDAKVKEEIKQIYHVEKKR